MSTYLKVWKLSCSFATEMAAVLIFSKICQKYNLFGRYFLIPQTPGICWTLDVSRTPFYEITLVCLSVCPSIRS